ncbi:hypothetical protein CCHOA_05125 [Corynebacterium choanae]|uniref:Uncharacterized protein n=1 Tax=Corynebacterium choanae TaxID=1862358 RepID=A0A3G6JAD6_9CORY|nr:hypothetical protein CCHOA_05125 [Corynebacterium choanae]
MWLHAIIHAVVAGLLFRSMGYLSDKSVGGVCRIGHAVAADNANHFGYCESPLGEGNKRQSRRHLATVAWGR